MRKTLIAVNLIAGSLSFAGAQEFREPDEVKEVVIKSTYPVRLNVVVTPDEEMYVWIGYRPVYKTTAEEGYHLAGFLADRLEVYKDGVLTRKIYDLKDIPNPRTVKNTRIGFALEMYPRVSEDGADRILLSSAAGRALPGLGFLKSEVALGPFPYQVNSVGSMVQADKGRVYLKAYCGNRNEEYERTGEVKPFMVLFALDRELKLVESFVYDKGNKRDLNEMHTSNGWDFVSPMGNLYQVDWESPARTFKIKIRKWKLKGT